MIIHNSTGTTLAANTPAVDTQKQSHGSHGWEWGKYETNKMERDEGKGEWKATNELCIGKEEYKWDPQQSGAVSIQGRGRWDDNMSNYHFEEMGPHTRDFIIRQTIGWRTWEGITKRPTRPLNEVWTKSKELDNKPTWWSGSSGGHYPGEQSTRRETWHTN